MRKILAPVFIFATISSCTKPQQQQQQPVAKTDNIDTVDADTASTMIQPVKRQLVVGFKEWDIYFTDWKPGHTLTFKGVPFDDSGLDKTTEFHLDYNHSRVLTVGTELWSNVRSLAISDSEHHVGKFDAIRTFADGTISYNFETDGAGIGAIVTISLNKPEYETWVVNSFSSTTDPATDSLISLVSSPFPLEVPAAEQKIGISFRTEEYNDGTFPRTRVTMRFTNFSSFDTNAGVIADVVGPVENTTDGKPFLHKDDSLVLKNFYAGLATQWTLVHEGDKLVLYEVAEGEPSMENPDQNLVTREELRVFQIPEDMKFTFCGYYPMSE